MSFNFSQGKTVFTSKIQEKETKKKNILEEIGSAFEKYILKPGAKISGMQKASELIEPITEFYASKFAPKNIREKILLSKKPASKSTAIAEEKGLGEGIKTIAGQSLETAANLAPFSKGLMAAKGATTVARSLNIGLKGATIGATAEAGEQLQEERKIDIGNIAKEAVKDFFISSALNFGIERISKVAQVKATKLYGRTFKPSTRELQSALEKNKDTINTQMSKEGYWGSVNEIKQKSQTNLKNYGQQIDDVASKAKGTINKNDIIKDLEKIFDANDVLDENELVLIIKQINKMPDEMTVKQAINFKRGFADKVTPSAWDNLANRADTFRNKIYKTLVGSFIRETTKKAPQLSGLNEKWSIAKDVVGLSSYIEGLGEGSRSLGEAAKGGVTNLIMNLPIIKQLSSPLSRTIRGQAYQQLSNLSKEELIQLAERYLILRQASE